jgi:YVTN family beta-propeller protein
MKYISQILIVFISTFIASCKDLVDSQPLLSVNYPVAYVVNGASSTLSVINLNTNEVANLIQLTDDLSGVRNSGGGKFLQYPHHIYLNPAKNQIAVAAPGMDLSRGHGTAEVLAHSGIAKVVILDAIKGVNLKLIDVPDMNHNAIYSPDGKEIWTSQMDEKGKVLVYDAITYTLKNSINVGKEPAEVTFSNDGFWAFVANGMDNSVSVINPNTKMVITTISVGKNPVGAWMGSDNRMYVDNEDGQSVSIIEVKTLKVVETVALGFMPGYAAFNDKMNELWVTDPTAGKLHWWKQDVDGKFAKGGTFTTANGAHAIAFKDMIAYITNQEATSVSVIDVMKHEKIKDIKVGEKPNGIVIRL